MDELDDQLGRIVAGRCLAAEDDGSRRGIAAALEVTVQRHRVQHVEVLALVLVDALDLHVEHGVGQQLDAVRVLRVSRQGLFVGPLDLTPSFAELAVVAPGLELTQAVEVV